MRFAVFLLSALLAALLTLAPAHAVEPDEILPDPAMETRARNLSAGLRCLVCQNQSIDDSNAPLARDLRLLVRERLKSGDSDEAVRTFVVQRYGEFVLLKPPLSVRTVLLWASPMLLLALTGFFVWRGLAARRVAPRGSESRLSPEEEARLARLTKKEKP